MHFLVTGMTGYLGGYVTAMLLSEGHTVTALVPDPELAFEIAEHGVRPHVGSVLDGVSVRRAMAGADGVFHLAGHRTGSRDPATAESLHVDGARSVLEAALEAGVGKVVFASSLVALGDTAGAVVDETHRPSTPPRTVYERAARRALFDVVRPMAEERGVPVVALLSGVVYGPDDTGRLTALLRRYLRGRVIAVEATAYCWAHVEDSARAHLLAMESGEPGDVLIVGGESATLRDLLTRVGRIAGRTRGPYPIPRWPAAASGAVLRPATAVVPRLRSQLERARLARGVTYLGDDAKARRVLGWRPRSLDAGLPDHVEWLLRVMAA
jgi:dihydroflavonol-4-reductase